jgi:RNA polymerase sigma-70 factor (ECF subfamily)
VPREETRALIGRARADEADALDELYRRVAGKLHALIRLRLGPSLRSRIESGDVLQAVLARSWQRLEQFRGEDRDSLMAWLARIAETEIRDQAERVGRQRRDAARDVPLDAVAETLPARVRTALSQAILDERRGRFERALEALPEEQRELIVLRRLEELDWAEIGRRLGRTPDACRVATARALAALTLALDDAP